MIGTGREMNYKIVDRRKCIPKSSFQQGKARKDGWLLRVEHTLPDADGNLQCYQFTQASFDLGGERLAVSDTLGHAFVIDLLSSKSWMLPKLPISNFLTYSHYAPKKQDVFVGCASGAISLINADTGVIAGELTGHKSGPLSVWFSEDEPYCLTVAADTAIIWDLTYNSLLFQLSLRTSVGIRLVRFMPVTNNIFGLFDDCSIHVWKLGGLDCTKQIFPEEWGGRKIKAVAFTRNGRGMVMGGLSASLAVFLLDNWSLQKVIAMPDDYKGVSQLEFVPQLFDGGANKILAVVCRSCLLFVDTETSVLLKSMERLEGYINRIETSLSGKYVVSVMVNGEVNVYASSQVLSWGLREQLVTEALGPHLSKSLRRELQTSDQTTASVGINQLLPILKEFGEYPESHRTLLWVNILKLPENEAAYIALINKGIHPAFSTLESVFPLTDRSLLNSVKRALSCLAYWNPIFMKVKYLPIFVLPFVKQYRHNQFACFEAITSIIVNWCQGWFQYVPYPALNILDSVSQLLSAHDDQLLLHYTHLQVTTDIYIWSLMETAFYEVLGWREWQQLWDHIISNHPAFLLFTVVAFNITCRTSILNINCLEDIQMFFHKEVAVNMKKLISKTYQLWFSTSTALHPKQYLKKYQPLIKGNMYQEFTDYSKHLLNNQLDKLSSLYEDKAALEEEKRKVTKQKEDVGKSAQKGKVSKNRSQELEEAYKIALKREEELLDHQRKHVMAGWRDLREKEMEIRLELVDRSRNKAEKWVQSEKLRHKVTDWDAELKAESGCSWMSPHKVTDGNTVCLLHASVVHHISKLRKISQQTNLRKNPKLKLCIAKFEELLVRIESVLDKEGHCRRSYGQCDKILSLQEETQTLENEAQELVFSLTNKVHHCCHAKQPMCSRRVHNLCYYCKGGENAKELGYK